MRRLYLFLLAFIALPSLCAQQKEFVFKNFTQEEGLPSNETYYVFEDSRHYMWVATDLGVVRYNGNKFEQFNLPDNVVFQIREDSKGRVWFFSHKALLAYFENEKMHLYKYNQNIAKRIEKINIVDAYVDENDNISLVSILDSSYTISAGGLISAVKTIQSSTKKSTFEISITKEKACFTRMPQRFPFDADSISIIVNWQSGKVKYDIPVSYRGFSHFGGIMSTEGDIYFFFSKIIVKLSKDGSYKIAQAQNEILALKMWGNNIWVGMFKTGAILLNGKTLHSVDESVLTGKSVTSINSDYENGLWFSTLENGVYYVKNTNILHIGSEDKTNVYVSRMAKLNDSVLVFAKTNGLYVYANGISKFMLPLPNITTFDMFADNTKTFFYFGSTPYITEIKKVNTPYFNCLYSLVSPSETVRLNRDSFITNSPFGLILFKSSYTSGALPNLTYDKGYGTQNSFFFHKPAQPYLDEKRNLWAAANDGLFKNSKTYDTMMRFLPGSALLANGVTCIRQMEKEYLAIGVRSHGVALLKDTTIICNITENEGLLSNKIRYLLPVKNQLWAATAKGISVIVFSSYSPLQYSITNIGKNDGFYNITINQLMPFGNKIAAATSNGIYFIGNTEAFLGKQFPPVPFYINTINTYLGDKTNISSLLLPYSNNRLVVKYNAVSFNAYENTRYQYRFTGGDTAWHTTTNTELLLENLEPGRYNLQIKAVIPAQHRQSALQTISITIQKPWWQNNWLRLLAALLTAGLVFWFVKNRIRKVKAEAKRKTELNAKLAELEQTALRSQMNPHFIFNCLTSIQQLIISGNKIDASEYLVKFARLIRKTLDMSAKPFIPISEEKAYLEEYLLLEQLRLSGQFEYNVNVAGGIDAANTFIPNMMVQPIVENCVRHGIKSLEGRKGLINACFSRSGNSVACTITDNGVGRKGISSFSENTFTKHKSYGMDIIQKRLETFAEYNEGESGISIEDLYDADGKPCGTKVILLLPYKKTL